MIPGDIGAAIAGLLSAGGPARGNPPPAALGARLGRAPGGEVLFFDFQQIRPTASTRQAAAPSVLAAATETVGSPAAIAGHGGQVQAAVAYHGADAVRYVLARTSAPSAERIGRPLALPPYLANPYITVRDAHAHPPP